MEFQTYKIHPHQQTHYFAAAKAVEPVIWILTTELILATEPKANIPGAALRDPTGTIISNRTFDVFEDDTCI